MSVQITTPFALPTSTVVIGPTASIAESVDVVEDAVQNPMHRGVASATDGTNVGGGPGLVYARKAGATIEHRTLVAGAGMTVATVGNTVELTSTAGAVPGGVADSIQTNDGAGGFGGDANLTYDGTAYLFAAAGTFEVRAGGQITLGSITANPEIVFTGDGPVTVGGDAADQMSFRIRKRNSSPTADPNMTTLYAIDKGSGLGVQLFARDSNSARAQITEAGFVFNQFPSLTVATAGSPAEVAKWIFVTDEAGGATPAFSDGTNWRRVSDLAIIS